MKKFLLSLSATALLATAAITNAQAQKGFSVGLTAAPQLSFMLNKDDADNDNYETKPQLSAAGGVSFGYNFTDRMGIGADVLYSVQGKRYKLYNTEYNQRINYVKVPVYFAYTIMPNHVVSFTAKGGPQVGFLVSSKLMDKHDNTINDKTDDAYNDVTVGGMLGFTANFRVHKNLLLTAGVRGDMSVSNAENEDYVGYPKDRESTFNFTPGLEFGIKYLFTARK